MCLQFVYLIKVIYSLQGKSVCFFVRPEMQRNSPCGPCHLKTGHQLKFRTVFDSEPHLQFTVFSRELLVLQASEDLKELISLPRLCLQEGHLFADGSG